MPLYEYRCQECGTPFAERRSIAERDNGICCPHCSAKRAVRLVSTFAAFGHGDGESVRSLGASGCSGCAQTSCQTCGAGRGSY